MQTLDIYFCNFPCVFLHTLHFENAIENWIFAHNSSLFTALTQKLLLIDFSMRIRSFFPNVEYNDKLNEQAMQFLKHKSHSALLLLDSPSKAPSQSFSFFFLWNFATSA